MRIATLLSASARLAAAPPASASPGTDVRPIAGRSTPALRRVALDGLFILGLVLAALPHRLANIDISGAKSDEGIRLLQLFLMSEGFRPISDIFASQGPLSLHVSYPLFVLFGGTLAAARLAVVTYSLAELAACYLLARQLGGRAAGLLAGLLLVLSPVYLKNSRTAFVEVPAMVPATLAIACAVRFSDVGQRPWLVASGLLLSLAVLIKPIVLAAGAPVLVALLLRRGGRWRSLLLYGLVAVSLVAVVVLLAGPTQLYDQVVRYRMGSAEAEGWSLAENLDTLADELRGESYAWWALAVAAVPLGLLAGVRRALPALAWTLATLGLLLVYSPLMPKHPVVLVPPVAVLVGYSAARWLLAGRELLAGRGRPARDGRTGSPRFAIRGVAALVVLALLAWYAAALPAVLARGWQVANAGTAADARDDALGEDVGLLTALTGRREYVIVDEPYLAYLSRRRVPPSLADPTEFRLRSGTLTGAEIVEAATAYDVKVMLLWSDGLRDQKKFGDWVDANYRQARIFERSNRKDKALYLRNDADLAAARELLRGGLSTAPAADFGGQLRLAAAGLDRTELRPGASLTISSEWESLVPLAADYHVLAIVRGRDGQTVAQIQRSLGGGGAGTSSWQPGRWTVRTFAVPIPGRTAPGEYAVSLAVYDSKARERVPLSSPVAGGSTDEARIATVSVR